MARTTHHRQRDHFGIDSAALSALATSTTTYVSGTTVQAAIADIDTRVIAASLSGGVTDLLTGNNSTFDASVGSWTNSGGTLTRDTTSSWHPTDFTASLKFVTTGTSQYIEVPVAGTFISGARYDALVWLKIEETGVLSSQAINLALGLQGTDTANTAYNFTNNGAYSGSAGYFAPIWITWIPSANRTGVTLRFARTTAGSTITFHIGWARAVAVTNPGDEGLGVVRNPKTTGYIDTLSVSGPNVVVGSNGSSIFLGGHFGNAAMQSQDGNASIGFANGSRGTSITAGATTGDFSNTGFNLEVGDDFIGLYVSEKNSSTVQIYADSNYDIELADTASNGWYSRDASNVIRRLAKMESRVNSGSATIASGTTAITITHGAGYTPTANDLVITPTNNPTNAPGNFWVSSIGSTTFDINVRSNPGTGGATFAWRVDR